MCDANLITPYHKMAIRKRSGSNAFPLVLLISLLGSGSTQAQSQNAPNIKALVQIALDKGESSGWLYGGLAKSFNRQLGLTVPEEKVYGTFKRLQTFDAHCGRFSVILEQPGMTAMGKDGKPHPAQFALDMNLCDSGTSPEPNSKPIQQP